MSRVRPFIVLAVVAAVAAGAVLAERWWHNHPPYAPSVLDAAAELHPVTDDQAQAFLGPAVDVPPVGNGGQLVAGVVRWRKPPTPEGSFSLYLIDEHTHRKPPVIETDGSRAAVGANGWDTEVAKRYPWLRGAGAVYRQGSWLEGGEDLTVALDDGVTTVTFIAVFPQADPGDQTSALHAAAPVDVPHLLVGLVFIGDDGQIYWARRLHG